MNVRNNLCPKGRDPASLTEEEIIKLYNEEFGIRVSWSPNKAQE